MHTFIATGVIQAMLTPAATISFCALLILSLNNKYSAVMGRVRALHQEYAKCNDASGKENIKLQLQELGKRLFLERNALLSYYCAIFMCILSMLTIGAQFFLEGWITLHAVALALFLIGAMCVICGVVCSGIETWKGYRVILIELSDIDTDDEEF